MMNFFGIYDGKMPDYSKKCGCVSPLSERWIRVENGLPDSDREVITLLKKERYDETCRYELKLQKFTPSNGWMSANGVIAWKECDGEMISMMKEKR